MNGVLRPALCLVCLLVTASARAQTWEPGRTRAFVVGVLERKDSAMFSSFPRKERRDAKLVDLLKQRGVATDRIVYLQDRAGTTATVLAALSRMPTSLPLVRVRLRLAPGPSPRRCWMA